MKLTILILSFTFFNLSCFSQDTLANSKRFPFSDTNLSVVYFANTLDLKNMVAVENSKNATIYINKDSIQSFVNRKLITSDYNKKQYNKILLELRRLKDGKIKDLTRLSFSCMNRIVAEQIMAGKAKIYDKLNQVYLTTAYHRIERVISTGFRTFYFSKTDRRYLYSYAEWQAIIPNELMPDIE
jgi:hypothetical protein